MENYPGAETSPRNTLVHRPLLLAIYRRCCLSLWCQSISQGPKSQKVWVPNPKISKAYFATVLTGNTAKVHPNNVPHQYQEEMDQKSSNTVTALLGSHLYDLGLVSTANLHLTQHGPKSTPWNHQGLWRSRKIITMITFVVQCLVHYDCSTTWALITVLVIHEQLWHDMDCKQFLLRSKRITRGKDILNLSYGMELGRNCDEVSEMKKD